MMLTEFSSLRRYAGGGGCWGEGKADIRYEQGGGTPMAVEGGPKKINNADKFLLHRLPESLAQTHTNTTTYVRRMKYVGSKK